MWSLLMFPILFLAPPKTPSPSNEPKATKIVLIGGSNSTKTIQFYYPDSPKNNTISSIKLLTPRDKLFAVTLGGQIFYGGGTNGTPMHYFDPEYNTTEMLDLKSKIVKMGPTMNVNREGPAAAVLNGITYVSGGSNIYDGLQVTCERLINDKWLLIGSLNHERAWHRMEAVGGRLFAMGGKDRLANNLKSVEKYEPKSDRWTFAKEMKNRRWAFGSAVIEGKIFVCGGYWNVHYHNDCERYDTSTDTWTSIAKMNFARASGFALVAFNEKLYALSGATPPGQFTSSVEVYSPSKNQWNVTSPVISAAIWEGAVVV